MFLKSLWLQLATNVASLLDRGLSLAGLQGQHSVPLDLVTCALASFSDLPMWTSKSTVNHAVLMHSLQIHWTDCSGK